jgi:hypothetical protein
MTSAQLDRHHRAMSALDQMTAEMDRLDKMAAVADWLSRQGVTLDDLDLFTRTLSRDIITNRRRRA